MTDHIELSEAEAGALREELADLDEQVKGHNALVRLQQMEELDRVMMWYAQNAAEVLATVEALNHDGLGTRLLLEGEVPFGGKDDEHRSYVTELGRTWHNWVAAANSFADHMRAQFKNEQPADLLAEYELKMEELLAPHDVVEFVTRSRNVLLHRGVFNTGFTWRFTRTTQHFEADCGTEILLNRYKSWWNPAARRYLESKSPRLNLGAAVEEHAEAITPLYQWYQDRVSQYHHPTLADFEATAARIREIQERLEPGSMPPHDPGAHFVSPEERDRSRTRPKPPPRKPRARSKSKKRRKRGR